MKFKKVVNLPLLLILHFDRVLISYKSLTQDFKSLIDLQIYRGKKKKKISNLVFDKGHILMKRLIGRSIATLGVGRGERWRY
jgi:hypothetical protein